MPDKRTAIFKPGRARQRGAVLMIMLVIMIIGAAAMFVSSLSRSALQQERNKVNANALAQAKEALIGYAVTYSDKISGKVFGYLPCPDTDGDSGLQLEGVGEYSTSKCNSSPSNKNVSVIGRLPWKTLDIAHLSDGTGECLWYAVSGTYKNYLPTDMMNWDTNGQFQVLAASGVILTGQTADSNAVAVIIAPDIALSSLSQNHTPDGTAPVCNGNYTASNYLDSDVTISANNAAPSTVAKATSQFFASGATDKINDRIVYITRDDIFNAIKKRNDFGTFVSTLLSTSTTCLTTTSPTPLPAPVTIDFSGSSPVETTGGVIVGSLETGRVPQSCLVSPLDNWQDNMLYAKCTDGSSCMTVNGASCRGVVIFPGERGSSQSRNTDTEKNTWSNYLEDTASPAYNVYTAFTTGATTFTGAAAYSTTSTSTDILACIP